MKNLNFNYILNIKNKKIGKLSTNISNFFKNINNINITIININYININKKLKKYYFKHTGFPGGLKKKNIINIKKELLIKNCLKKMLPKNKKRKIKIKKIFFVKKKNLKYKIINI